MLQPATGLVFPKDQIDAWNILCFIYVQYDEQDYIFITIN